MWLNAIDHIQITVSPETEKETLFFYSTILELPELPKPDAIKASGGAWFKLGDIQLHVSTEQNVRNDLSRRHICFQVGNLEAFQQHLTANGIDIIPDLQPITGYNRFSLI